MRKVLFPAAAAIILATSSLSFAAAHVARGTVKEYDAKTMTIMLEDGTNYMVSKHFKDPGLKAGDKVTINWEMSGKHKLAEKVSMAK